MAGVRLAVTLAVRVDDVTLRGRLGVVNAREDDEVAGVEARELRGVEHAHLRPRFVEDSVRIAIKELLDARPDLARAAERYASRTA